MPLLYLNAHHACNLFHLFMKILLIGVEVPRSIKSHRGWSRVSFERTNDAQRPTRFKAWEHVGNDLTSLPRVQLKLAARKIKRKWRFALVDPVERLAVVPGTWATGEVVEHLSDRVEREQERGEFVEVGGIRAGEEFGDQCPDGRLGLEASEQSAGLDGVHLDIPPVALRQQYN